MVAKAQSAVPTGFLRLRMVVTLRFAHPTHLTIELPSLEIGDAASAVALTLLEIFRGASAWVCSTSS